MIYFFMQDIKKYMWNNKYSKSMETIDLTTVILLEISYLIGLMNKYCKERTMLMVDRSIKLGEGDGTPMWIFIMIETLPATVL